MTSLAPIFLWRICCLFWFSITENILFTKLVDLEFASVTLCALYYFIAIVSCITDNFSVLIIVITEEWISISAEILPVFRAFPVQGPNITSRAVAREVMLGPKDRKCPKNGQNRGGNGYSSEGMSMISKLKLSVIHIILCYSRDFALPKTWFLSSCLTTKSLYIRFIF